MTQARTTPWWLTELAGFAQYLGVIIAGTIAGYLNFQLSAKGLNAQVNFVVTAATGFGLAFVFWVAVGRFRDYVPAPATEHVKS